MERSTSLQDASVVIFGGSSGIGLATAVAARDAGARMTIAGRDDVIKAMARRVPLGRVAQPEEIADRIVFLMTNSYVTGTTLTIDGGSSLV